MHLEITNTGNTFPYDMDNPEQVIPIKNKGLEEISGLGLIGPGIICAIADQKGTAYFIDVNTEGSIVKELPFFNDGDFEAIELVGQTIFALKSDGKLFEIINWKNEENMKVVIHNTPLNKEDNLEGLCYDPSRNALLLVCKNEKTKNNPRRVLAFDLKDKTLGMAPVYTIYPEEVNNLLPYGPHEDRDYFSPSGIAIHPFNQDVYILSTALKRMVVLDYSNGRIRYAVRLDKKFCQSQKG